MKFLQLYTALVEQDENDEQQDDVKKTKAKSIKVKANPVTGRMDATASKNIQLVDSDVKISKKIVEDEYFIEIRSNLDPNMKGEVEYDSKEEMDIAFKNLNTVGDVLNYMNVNMKNYSSAFGWSDILSKEIVAMKRDMTEDEIADLKLDFKV